MQIIDLRILPPIAIGRLGSGSLPLDAFNLEINETNPLDFRNIVPKESLRLDLATGKIEKYQPAKIIFKEAHNMDDKNGAVRPVAPFLEVFAITDDNPQLLVPLTTALLTAAGFSMNDLHWQVELGNNKLFRRTGSPKDKIKAEIKNISTHEQLALEGKCDNFLSGKILPLGHVQFVQPSEEFPAIRFRFTPASGRVYGSAATRIMQHGQKPVPDPLYAKYGMDFIIYDKEKDWCKYVEGNQERPVLTNPGGIFAGYNTTDAKTGADVRASWGYLDDECDGSVSFYLKNASGKVLSASAHVCAGPPAYAPDTLPVRVVTDELEQILLGPEADKEVSIEDAEDIVRRALETVRMMNTAVMNGNPVNGRERTASTMVAQDSNDFGRMYEPIMAVSLVDNLAVRAIHQRVFNGISTGASPWFENALRRPDEIGDLSNGGRRKMPAMMRGADGRALCFTYRQINTIIKSAASAMFRKHIEKTTVTKSEGIGINDFISQIHYLGKGNPYSILPRTAISNCFPGLEMDFRNLWRRAFKEITLLESSNFVLEGTGKFDELKYHRLVAIDGEPTMVITTGPTFPNSGNNTLINVANPNGVSFMEWSNNLAKLLQKQGQQVDCYFTKHESNVEVVFEKKDLKDSNHALIKVKLTVNTFFEENSATFADGLLQPGELTQGLCAPWQNDYRECACYYWAASRPDYVNVIPDEKGLSKGDNWMSKKRSGAYIPDNRSDDRLITYDDLFENWEGELNFIVKGFDALDSDGDKKIS